MNKPMSSQFQSKVINLLDMLDSLQTTSPYTIKPHKYELGMWIGDKEISMSTFTFDHKGQKSRTMKPKGRYGA